MRELAGAITALLPKGIGFTLFLFDFGAGGHMSYLSNARADDVVKLIREFLSHVEHFHKVLPDIGHPD